MKKVLSIMKNIFVWLVVLLAISMMIFTIISVNSFDRTDRDILGYKAFIVRSNSMSATDFSAGDLVLIKEVDPTILKEGDIISFRSTGEDNYGEVVTHKIRELTLDENGEAGFITYGTTTNHNDDKVVTYQYVLGKYQGRLAGVGNFFAFLKTVPGYIVCIFLPFMILIFVQAINSIKLFRQYKKEQLDELKVMQEKERIEIEMERKLLKKQQEESKRMMEELLKLKNELSNNESNKN